jgi:ectoine hydroxylase-related dioxygenase (phytanoyl-CoA dioxygenase family)
METFPLSQPGAFTDMDRFMFECFGYLIIEDVLNAEECEKTLEAATRIHQDYPKDDLRQVGKGFYTEPAMERLIDHPAILPKIRGLLGDNFVLGAAWCTILPAKYRWLHWHQDGSSVYDYKDVGYPIPLLQLRASYNLTDQSELNMGNMMMIPGSHRSRVSLPRESHEALVASPIQQTIRAKAGSVLLFHNGVYHTPMPNDMDYDRYNMHYIYCPIWMRRGDRQETSPEFLERTSPRRRAMMGDFNRADAPFLGGFTPIPFDDEWVDPGLEPELNTIGN